MDTFKTHPKYFDKGNSFYFTGVGLNSQYVSIGKDLPKSSRYISVTEDQAIKINEFSDSVDKLTKAKSELYRDIENALFNLRTYNNVKEQFPEAFLLLPPSLISTSVSLNISDIRCKLDKNNC
jgi:hypothetical protein